MSKKKPENEKKEIWHRYNNRVAEFANSNKVKENQRNKIQRRKEEFSIRRLNELREIKPDTNPYFPNKENMYWKFTGRKFRIKSQPKWTL